MKRCPTCEKTFDDSMRFCQSDGTPLIEDAMPVDPYKTMVASKEDIAAAIPPLTPAVESKKEEKKEDVLDLPVESDPLKTMYASEKEIRQEMDKLSPPAENVIDIPPFAPEPPKFNEPILSPPSFGEKAPPPSVDVSAGKTPFNSSPPPSPFEMTTPPIPSPFYEPKAESSQPPAPTSPAFKEPKPIFNEPQSNPFDQAQKPAAWTPPATPDAGRQNQDIMQNTPIQPTVAGASGPSSILAIVSLILGIVGFLGAILTLVVSIIPLLNVICGALPFLLGVGAVITGFLARSRAKNMPDKYGGKGIALVGLILGVLDIIAPFVLVGFWILLGQALVG